MNRPKLLVPLAILALTGCGRGAGDHSSSVGPAGSASSPAPSGSVAPAGATGASSSSPLGTGAAAATAVPEDPPPDVTPPATFVGARTEKACRAQTAELATYQVRGEMALAGQGEVLAASWRVRLAGKREEQIAFATFDREGHPLSRPRGVGETTHDVPPRVLATGTGFAALWFDGKGLAYARPKTDPLPPPDVSHVSAVGSDVSADVAIARWPSGGGVAASPFGADKAQLGLFVFAPEDGPAVKAMGVTHHAHQPHAPAIAAGPLGTFVMWEDGGAILASKFDPAGKEGASACTVARPGGPARDRLALAATPTGAVALWMEGAAVRTRALDASACPSSPIWTVAEGRWATLAPLGETPLVAWVNRDNHLLVARLAGTGAPPARGLDASEGTSGVKDAPAVVAFGGKAAFGWAEVMSPAISTKRLSVRIVDAACVP